MTTEDFLKTHICNHCHIALMYEHKEFNKYLKCTFCGFTKEIEFVPIKEIHKITGNNG